MEEILKTLKNIAINDSVDVCKTTKYIEESEFLNKIEKLSIEEITLLTVKMLNVYQAEQIKNELINNNECENKIKIMQ